MAFRNSHISTYTYKPLIGILSEKDPMGISTYYEYDTFNRLNTIKDDARKTLKSFQYNKYSYLNIHLDWGVGLRYIVNQDSYLNVDVEGGSGLFSYHWIATDASGKIVINKQTDVPNVRYIFSDIGNAALSCTIKDLITKEEKTINKTIRILPKEAKINISSSVPDSDLILNESSTFVATATDGSGSFTYYWTLQDSRGNTLQSQGHSTDKNFVVQFKKHGDHILSCVTRDIISEEEHTTIKPFRVAGFKLDQITSVGQYQKDVKYSFTVNASKGSGNYTYKWYAMNRNGEATVNLTEVSGKLCNMTFLENGPYLIGCTIKDNIRNIEEKIEQEIQVYSLINDTGIIEHPLMSSINVSLFWLPFEADLE